MIVSVVTILWKKIVTIFVTTETPPNVLVVTVSVVTILDTFEPSSKMLIST